MAFMNVLVDKLLPLALASVRRGRAVPARAVPPRQRAYGVQGGQLRGIGRRPSASRPTSRVWESGGRDRRSVLPRIFALKTRHSA
ncbi:MAG: hypothetical protein ACLSVD_07620 [Eggerthellaceae bacterium]